MYLSILGGDGRMQEVARLAAAAGHTVTLWGCTTAADESHTPAAALRKADVVLLPHPLTRDGEHLNARLPLPLMTLLELLPATARVYSGGLPPSGMLPPGQVWLDYAANEGYLLRNAALTAEATIGILLRELPYALSDAQCTVVGWGRIARYLVRLLRPFGTAVTIAARSPVALQEIAACGCTPLSLAEGTDALTAPGGGVLINTVPAPLYSRRVLERFPRDLYLMELASGRANFDRVALRELGLHLRDAPGLPGAWSPVSAGDVLWDTVQLLLRETRGGIS